MFATTSKSKVVSREVRRACCVRLVIDLSRIGKFACFGSLWRSGPAPTWRFLHRSAPGEAKPLTPTLPRISHPTYPSILVTMYVPTS